MPKIKITKVVNIKDERTCAACQYAEIHNDILTDSWCGYCYAFDKRLDYSDKEKVLLRCEACKKAEVKE